VIGFADRGIPEVKVNHLLLRNIIAVDVAWVALLLEQPARRHLQPVRRCTAPEHVTISDDAVSKHEDQDRLLE
jgi:hypothetical protein